MFLRTATVQSTNAYYDKISRLKHELETADAVIVGAGAGLSASAGLDYAGKRFERYFGDFQKKYGIRDMYSGGFYPFASLEEHWAWWSRQIMLNRYGQAPKPVYEELLGLVNGKDYLTRNDCSTPRGTTACGNAPSPAIRRPTTIRRRSGTWWRPRASA